ncbi:hypothetical protein M0P65_07445 [Candidatus Gracilibacteria bacterium]|nr:hypothetical protein [Candidatus Gracilibacteria bacterium]
MSKYKESRIKNGLSDKVSIDPCIIEEIKELWNKGIITYGSCCGHNLYESFVNVDESNIEQMLSMGYVMNHKDKSRKDTFRLKMIN